MAELAFDLIMIGFGIVANGDKNRYLLEDHYVKKSMKIVQVSSTK